MPRTKKENSRTKVEISTAWNKEHLKAYTFRFNVDTQRDIIEQLESKPNKNGYIADLIRKDLIAEGKQPFARQRVCDVIKNIDDSTIVVLLFKDGSRMIANKIDFANDKRCVEDFSEEDGIRAGELEARFAEMKNTKEENGKVIANNFGMCGLPVTFVKGTSNKLGTTLLFDMVDITKYDERKIKDAIKKQSIFYHLDMSFIQTEEAHFGMFVKTKNVKLTLAEVMDYTFNKMIIGKDAFGNDVSIDFDKTPHLLIAGTTGSGKTVLLKNLIMNIYPHYPSIDRQVAIMILDTKYELRCFSKLKNVWFFGENAKSASKESIYNALWNACNIMDRRYKGQEKNTFELFVIIDELADLMLTTDVRDEVEEMIVRLASKGRACGIHLIVATQSPRVSVISGLIKANMPYRIALKTASIRESVIVLEHKGAEQLAGNGDCVFQRGIEETHMQVAYPEESHIKMMIDKLGGGLELL